ncbi:MAG: hypothetical protein QOI42_571 [Frankiaceae bacterium]|jgi:hypothetical protein|nr:hypothetical protein [Frankiaceae bacterium]
MVRFLPCPTCADEQPFDQPGCQDGHGRDCPEWFCRACGEAIVVDSPVVDSPVAIPRGRRPTTVAA